ncbi:MAG TPA: hypothetical protein VMU17_01560 [Elusimicrobiota bacterium]|nr:hypothetical protein [Elusimicrobiota bacterium]
MLDKLMDNVNATLDSLSSVMWGLFEKDMATLERILKGTEWLLATVESIIPSGLRRMWDRNFRR